MEAACRAGINNFESAIGGFGGWPMTGYELLGNLDTLNLVDWCYRNGIETGIDPDSLFKAAAVARQIFQSTSDWVNWYLIYFQMQILLYE